MELVLVLVALEVDDDSDAGAAAAVVLPAWVDAVDEVDVFIFLELATTVTIVFLY